MYKLTANFDELTALQTATTHIVNMRDGAAFLTTFDDMLRASDRKNRTKRTAEERHFMAVRHFAAGVANNCRAHEMRGQADWLVFAMIEGAYAGVQGRVSADAVEAFARCNAAYETAHQRACEVVAKTL